MNKEYETWLNTKPQHIKDAAKKYPPGTIIDAEGEYLYVIGYSETGDDNHKVRLMVSTTDPYTDYDKAMATKQYICAHCVGQAFEK